MSATTTPTTTLLIVLIVLVVLLLGLGLVLLVRQNGIRRVQRGLRDVELDGFQTQRHPYRPFGHRDPRRDGKEHDERQGQGQAQGQGMKLTLGDAVDGRGMFGRGGETTREVEDTHENREQKDDHDEVEQGEGGVAKRCSSGTMVVVIAPGLVVRGPPSGESVGKDDEASTSVAASASPSTVTPTATPSPAPTPAAPAPVKVLHLVPVVDAPERDASLPTTTGPGGSRTKGAVDGSDGVVLATGAWRRIQPDEIAVRAGDPMTIHQFFQDGWALGMNFRSGMSGMFPLAAVRDGARHHVPAASGPTTTNPTNHTEVSSVGQSEPSTTAQHWGHRTLVSHHHQQQQHPSPLTTPTPTPLVHPATPEDARPSSTVVTSQHPDALALRVLASTYFTALTHLDSERAAAIAPTLAATVASVASRHRVVRAGERLAGDIRRTSGLDLDRQGEGAVLRRRDVGEEKGTEGGRPRSVVELQEDMDRFFEEVWRSGPPLPVMPVEYRRTADDEIQEEEEEEEDSRIEVAHLEEEGKEDDEGMSSDSDSDSGSVVVHDDVEPIHPVVHSATPTRRDDE
ncbi:hypothetical protein HKX48_009441 [Thoreauomyces humboldtii]|nr:hypothetical protein HKX48_009441 [Thoreauomyces humboldtii]